MTAIAASDSSAPAPGSGGSLGKYLRGLGPPLLLWGFFVIYLFFLKGGPGGGDRASDEAALQEWIEASQIANTTLPGLIREYLQWAEAGGEDLGEWREKVQAFLKTLGEPTKEYQGQLPFFPVIYRIELVFQENPRLSIPAKVYWDSEVPRQPSQFRWLVGYPIHEQVRVNIQYQLHAYNKQRRDEQESAVRVRWVSALTAAATALAFLWIYLVHRAEQERSRQGALAQQKIGQAERKLLEQRLATEESERKLLELKSQLFANIGIMAGSYAHNIKNLLVRPNDLLRRCLEADGLSTSQENMLGEVRHTLGTVTERLQQILHTVRRDPSQAELTRIDLNELAAEMYRTWDHLAREKWKLHLSMELWPEPLVIEGDQSHLQQATENLLFNARDATFEMRNYLRDQARDGKEGIEDRRQALIAAASWKGQVVLRTRRHGGRAVLEVQDNGIGMSEEVRRRCTETHYSTKRNNALYEGYSAGMGLGLSFVVVVLEHQHATLDIESAPLAGTRFRISFPLAA